MNRFHSCFLLICISTASFAGDLETLIQSYEREKARVLAPVEQKYEQALEELKLKYTKAGQLDEAVAVAAILNERKGLRSGDWLRKAKTTWKWHSGGQLDILPNGESAHSKWKARGTWKRLDETSIQIINDREQMFTVVFNEEQNSADGTAKNGWKTQLTLSE